MSVGFTWRALWFISIPFFFADLMVLVSGNSPACQFPVPQESTWKLDFKECLSKWCKNNASANGLLQIFPKQTNNTFIVYILPISTRVLLDPLHFLAEPQEDKTIIQTAVNTNKNFIVAILIYLYENENLCILFET